MDGRFIVVNGLVNQQPVNFLVDTGATKTILDVSLRSELGPSLGKAPVASPEGGVELEEFGCPVLIVGSFNLKTTGSIFCFDLENMQAAIGEKFTGILGMDALQSFVLSLDFDEGSIELSKHVREPNASRGVALPLSFERGTPQLSARCGSISRQFLVDTAASGSCLEGEVFDALAKAGELTPGPAYVSLTAVGRTSGRVGLLQELELGPFMRRDCLCEESGMNLLGLTYLSRYKLTFDFPNGVAYLKRGRNFEKPELRGTSGLSLKKSDGEFVVISVKPGGPAASAGLERGDRVVAINGEEARNIDLFRARQLLTTLPGENVRIELMRNVEHHNVSLVVQDRVAR
jgi:predicted aspartyl protease